VKGVEHVGERKQVEERDSIIAFDFVINALLEHEKSLSNLATALERITKQLGKVGSSNAKIHEIEDSLSTIEQELSNFRCALTQKKPADSSGNLLIAECKQWEDFKVLATNAEIISFLLNDTPQVNALKGVFIPTYRGYFPKELSQDKKSLKTWLSSELNILENKIFEGSLVLK